jgi:hypothetical protein
VFCTFIIKRLQRFFQAQEDAGFAANLGAKPETMILLQQFFF